MEKYENLKSTQNTIKKNERNSKEEHHKHHLSEHYLEHQEYNQQIKSSSTTFVEHFVELRKTIIKITLLFLTISVACFTIAEEIFNLLILPYKWANKEGVKLIYIAPQEYLITKIKLSLFGSAFISLPVVINQLYIFIRPALYKREKKAFKPYLIATPIFFFAGALLVYFLVMPTAMKFFISMQQNGQSNIEIELLSSVSSYLSLITNLILAFGACFQIPVILAILAKLNYIDHHWLSAKRRYAIVLMFAIAALVTPPDIISQIALALPMLALYELTLIFIKKQQKKK